MERKVYTNWSEATTSYSAALAGLISAIEAGKNAWIEVRKNGEQDYPIMVPNPKLNHPRAWTMSYSIPRNRTVLENHKFINNTEKDLTLNYTVAFGTQEAIDRYYETGILTSDNFRGMGICHAVKIEDAIEYRKNIDGYKDFHNWIYFWKPQNNDYWVPADIDKVFTVCYDDQPTDKKIVFKRAAELLLKLAED